jgi:hypothetical protein
MFIDVGVVYCDCWVDTESAEEHACADHLDVLAKLCVTVDIYTPRSRLPSVAMNQAVPRPTFRP